MSVFREAIIELLGRYERYPEKVAKLMEIDRLGDYGGAKKMLESYREDLTDLIRRLEGESLPPVVIPVQESEKHGGRRKAEPQPEPPAIPEDPAPNSIYVARAYLRKRGYTIARGSMVALYTRRTRRCPLVEKDNKWGFTFRHK